MMLVAYDPNKEHKIITDASEEGLGYILMQLHEEEGCICKKKDGTCKWMILYANSTVLKPS